MPARGGRNVELQQKRDEAKRRLQWEKRQRERLFGPGNTVDVCIVDNLDIHSEISYITQRAQAAEMRIVTIENLILFSTNTRDAWMLDPEDNWAACVCRDGEPQSVQIVETPKTFSIDWPAKFAIDGEAFVVLEKPGRVVTLHGYPTADISAHCELVRNARGG